MKRLTVLLVAAALMAACGGTASVNVAAKPSTPPGPVTKYRNALPGQTAVAPIDLIQSILSFAPGAASVVHKHTSPNLGTVLQGQVTIKMASGDKQASAGEALVEPLNESVQAVNMGSGDAMVAVAFPVLHGAKPTAPVAGQPAPATPNKTLYTYTLASPSINGGYSLIQQVLDFAPGAQTLKHRHGGSGVITVLQGQVTLNTDGVEKTYNAGDSFTELPGQTLQAFNRGSTELIVVATFILADGAQLTTNV
ncbi:MAG TPA: cupin domain-containing protein [Candidatus Dormibacteraeota bacterium]